MILFIEYYQLYLNIKIMTYIIIKMMKNPNGGNDLPVVLLSGEEVWTFDNVDDAIKMSERLTLNSDSGHRYYVKKA